MNYRTPCIRRQKDRNVPQRCVSVRRVARPVFVPHRRPRGKRETFFRGITFIARPYVSSGPRYYPLINCRARSDREEKLRLADGGAKGEGRAGKVQIGGGIAIPREKSVSRLPVVPSDLTMTFPLVFIVLIGFVAHGEAS